MKINLASVAMVLLMVVIGCKTYTVPPTAATTITTDTAARASVPVLSETSYFHEISAYWSLISASDSLIGIIRNHGISVSDSWSPLTPSPCDMIMPTEAVIVSLTKPDSTIGTYGWSRQLDRPLNCGIQQFLHRHYSQ